MSWAFELAKAKPLNGSKWSAIRERHKLWNDTWFGIEFGIAKPGSLTEDVMIQWTWDAVDFAKSVAEEYSWSETHWRELFNELVKLG